MLICLVPKLLELNSPKAVVTKAASKSQDSSKVPPFNLPNRVIDGNGVSVSECKEHMLSLEKELEKLLKTNLAKKGMINMG